MSTGEDLSQNNLDGGSDSLNTLFSLTDKWQEFREVDDVSDLKVHTIPEKIDPRTVPKLTVAMLDLLEQIESHSGPAINLFDEIMQWVLFFSRKYPRVFIDIGTGTPTTRNALINRVRKLYGKDLPPNPVNKQKRLPSGKVTTIPTFPFPECLLPMLDDDMLTDKYFVRDNFDRDTFAPKVPIYNTTRFDEMNSFRRSMDDIRKNEVSREAIQLDMDLAPMPKFSNLALKGKKIQVLTKMENSDMRLWGCTINCVLKGPTARLPIAKLNVTWEAMPDLHWEQYTGDTEIDTRLWNCADKEGGWMYCLHDEPESSLPSSPANNTSHICPEMNLDKVSKMKMMEVPVGDLYSGAMMTRAQHEFVGNTHDPPKGVDKVRGCPLTLFADATHSDSRGALKSEPYVLCPGWMNMEERAKEENNFVLGILPNLEVGRGRRAGAADMEMRAIGREKRPPGQKRHQNQ